MLDGDVILPANGPTLSERRKLAANGLISVAIARGKDGRVRGEPTVSAQGVPVEDEREAFLEELSGVAREAADDGPRDLVKLKEAVRLAVRRRATDWTGKKPVVDVLLLSV